MRKILSVLLFCMLFAFYSSAHEGMWLPILLDMDDMQRQGLKLSAEDIYSVNQASLKDAIVHFGGGCTAEAISDQGLILTNHHCGYGAIQELSSVTNDYLKDGFWAGNQSQELSCQGLSASFVVRIEDVTAQILEGIDEDSSLEERQTMIAMHSLEMSAEMAEGEFLSAEVKSFFYGNQYILIVKKTYNDVRLVGAPPSSIGKFGGDTDNWVWPRHTGDFALFRIYANEKNEPAAYSETNQPYRPAHSLPVSIKGVKEGDFTMVYGFPGVTYQYLPVDGLRYVTEVVNPIRIGMRKKSLSVIDATMEQSDALRIQYASRQSMISNAYKKWIGQNMGLDRFNAVDKKIEFEERFTAAAEESGNGSYMRVLPELRELQLKLEPYELARDLFIEFYFYGPEILNFARRFDALLAAIEEDAPKEKVEELREKALKATRNFHEDFHRPTDQEVFSLLLEDYALNVRADLQPTPLSEFRQKFNSDAKLYSEALYGKSLLTNVNQLTKLLESGKYKKIARLNDDPIYALAKSFIGDFNEKIRPDRDQLTSRMDDAMRTYVAAQMELFPSKTYWPDANSTLRVTYGKVEGCVPQDGLSYLPNTTLQGVMYKYIPGDKEFDVPKKLIDLFESKDFGRYGQDGTLNVAFLASNHTTGGNSGSPVINANGELIGLNFDRSWESTMSDLMFNPEICRNISVDVRYILFVVDKFAGAGWILDEMNIIQ